MYQFKTALQLYSVREDMEKDFRGTLMKVKEMGYDGIEFAGLFDYTAVQVREMCAQIGLVPISAHVPYLEMLKGEETFKLYKEIGCKYIVIPCINAENLAGGENNEEFITNVKLLGSLAQKHGIKLCYHNHDFEFEKVNGEYKLDLLYQRVPKELLSTQLDTCWVGVGGVNPASYIRKYAGRVEIIHLKDFVGSKNDNIYGLVGKSEGSPKQTEEAFDYRPLGSGLQDFHEILDACKDAGTEWLVVEQDRPCLDKTALECSKESIQYLGSIGV